MINRRHRTTTNLNTRIAELERRIISLEADLHEASHSDIFGCLNRSGLLQVLRSFNLAGLTCVYWDLDDLKACNDRWGKIEVGRRVREAITARVTDVVAGQVFSGDEFCAFPPEDDATPFAHRLLLELQAYELSATFAIVRPLPNETAHDLLARAERMVTAFKKLGKGRIYEVGLAHYGSM